MKKDTRVIIIGPNGYELGLTVIDGNSKFEMVKILSGDLLGMVASFDSKSIKRYSPEEVESLAVVHCYEKKFALD